jgi:hypothetical protein
MKENPCSSALRKPAPFLGGIKNIILFEIKVISAIVHPILILRNKNTPEKIEAKEIRKNK